MASAQLERQMYAAMNVVTPDGDMQGKKVAKPGGEKEGKEVERVPKEELEKGALLRKYWVSGNNLF